MFRKPVREMDEENLGWERRLGNPRRGINEEPWLGEKMKKH